MHKFVPLILCIFTTILRSNFQQNKNPERKHSFLCFLSGF
ncbi:hypothetical protein RUMOBE_03986 [Blautia obeum ATCC 29174]|uniref:Uncharacterized protein n=1 Tax=Blautia obeum ATCC 29174 TaxID=411459 RepID=A5ZY78_9FIRM|nr:hypothetical protein RUMOBE_03986 [Blautia obeum ATCC 29174]